MGDSLLLQIKYIKFADLLRIMLTIANLESRVGIYKCL